MITKAIIKIRELENNTLDGAQSIVTFKGDDVEALASNWSKIEQEHLASHRLKTVETQLTIMDRELSLQALLIKHLNINHLKRWFESKTNAYAHRRREDFEDRAKTNLREAQYRHKEAVKSLKEAELNLLPLLKDFLGDRGFKLDDMRISDGATVQEWSRSVESTKTGQGLQARLFDASTNEMIEAENTSQLVYILHDNFTRAQGLSEPMLHTGVKDDSGKPIYAEDIVERKAPQPGGKDITGVVRILEGAWVIDSGEDAVDLWTEVDQLTVLGNAYQNPELTTK